MSSVVRVGAVADLHYRKASQGELVSVLGQAAQCCDVLLLPGDLTDSGVAGSALLARDLAAAVSPGPGRPEPRLRERRRPEVARILGDASGRRRRRP
jgi:hypothetical protein